MTLQQQQQQQHAQQIRGKPALEIYRPPSNNRKYTATPLLHSSVLIKAFSLTDVRIDGNPQNKLNVHAQEFTMSRNDLQTSK